MWHVFVCFFFSGREKGYESPDFCGTVLSFRTLVFSFLPAFVCCRTKCFEDSPSKPCAPFNAFPLIVFYGTCSLGFVFSDLGWHQYIWQWLLIIPWSGHCLSCSLVQSFSPFVLAHSRGWHQVRTGCGKERVRLD